MADKETCASLQRQQISLSTANQNQESICLLGARDARHELQTKGTEEHVGVRHRR